MAGCCDKSGLRSILFISNLLLAFIGVLVLCGGIWLVANENSTLHDSRRIISTVDFIESVPGDVHKSFEEIYNDYNFFCAVIGFGALSVIISFSGYCGCKIGSGRLFCLTMFFLLFAVILFTLQIAVVASIHQRNVDIEDFQNEYNELRNVNLEMLEGSGDYQTVFFGVLTAISFGYLCLMLFILVEVIESMPK